MTPTRYGTKAKQRGDGCRAERKNNLSNKIQKVKRGRSLRNTITSFFKAKSHFTPSKSKTIIQSLNNLCDLLIF